MVYILFENVYCTNLRRLKSYQVSFPTTMEWNWKWVAEETLFIWEINNTLWNYQ